MDKDIFYKNDKDRIISAISKVHIADDGVYSVDDIIDEMNDELFCHDITGIKFVRRVKTLQECQSAGITRPLWHIFEYLINDNLQDIEYKYKVDKTREYISFSFDGKHIAELRISIEPDSFGHVTLFNMMDGSTTLHMCLDFEFDDIISIARELVERALMSRVDAIG
ncbi:MAG: hypothetical protein M0R03_23880 [Novosphingobium sp.]|nr:hypothetical protein [Novosphingobium sp.]